MSVSEHASVVKLENDSVVGYIESERDGLKISADAARNESVEYSLTGAAPQGEEDTLTASCILIKALNAIGANWRDPVVGEEPADCSAEDFFNGKLRLDIQVVRAISSPELWKELNTLGSVSEVINLNNLTAELRKSLLLKEKKIPPSSRNELVLALDGNRMPSIALTFIKNHVISNLSHFARSLGYKQVWIIGPTPDLSYRLDVEAV